MNEDKNITHTDMRFFQNDLLNDLKKLELQLNGKIAGINQLVLTKVGDYDSKFTKIFENITELINQLAKRKFDNDRVEELLQMRNKFSDQIIESQSKIAIIEKTLETSLFRYDKIILDNLSVPGLIGVGSKFKNCASYFRFLDNEYQVNQKYKEEGLSNFKSLSDKVEIRLKKVEADVGQIMATVNRICEVKFQKMFTKMEEKALATANLVSQCRIENSKYAQNLIKASTDLKIQWDKLENIKNEIYGKFDAELEVFKKLVLVTDNSYKKQEKEFEVFKQRFTKLIDYLKDVKNLGKNYREMTRNIDFSRKQKLEDDYDQGKYEEIGENIHEYIKSPMPHRSTLNLKNINKKEEEENLEKAKNQNIDENKKIEKKRTSLSPSPRKSMIYMKRKKITELEKINKIAKEGNQRMSNVFSFKTKFKGGQDKEENIENKNMNDFYKNDINKKNGIINGEDNKNKKKTKNSKNKKTIVTENNIDLNFDMNNGGNKVLNEEESEDSSSSSDFSLSSIISLKKIGDDTKDENDVKEKKEKENKKENKLIEKEKENKKETKLIEKEKENKEKKEKKEEKEKKEDIELYSNTGEKSEGEITKSSKFDIDKKSEGNITVIGGEKDNRKNKEFLTLTQKRLRFEPQNNLINAIKTENTNIINRKNDLRSSTVSLRELSRKRKYFEKEKKSTNKIKLKNVKINIPNENTNILNRDMDKKNTSPKSAKRMIDTEKNSILKNKANNNLLILNNETKNEINKSKDKNIQTIPIINKQIKQVMDEYTYKNNKKNTIPRIKNTSNKISSEITFPQIKITSNEVNKKEDFQTTQVLKTLTNTPKANKKINNRLILSNNKKPFLYKPLLDNQRLITYNNYENKDTMSASLEKKDEKESKEKIEEKDNKLNKEIINNKKEKEEINKEININNKEKEEKSNEISGENIEYKNNEIKEVNKKEIKDEIKAEIKQEIKDEIKEEITNRNNDNDVKDKEDTNIRNLFNSLYVEIKEIKDITNKNKIKEKEIDNNNKDAFLTSLNNINNNYNYYYNNNNTKINNINGNNQLKPKINVVDEATIKKFNNDIDFINGNIKLVNHRITSLEEKYQLILNQLNNIFKTVSIYYHHHKRKSDVHHTMRMKNKLANIRTQKTDYQKEEDLDDKKFMLKLKDMYNDDYENVDEYKLRIPNNEFSKTLRRIEPFLIKKFKKV